MNDTLNNIKWLVNKLEILSRDMPLADIEVIQHLDDAEDLLQLAVWFQEWVLEDTAYADEMEQTP